MRATFVAEGPDFRRDVELPPFDNVDVYPARAASASPLSRTTATSRHCCPRCNRRSAHLGAMMPDRAPKGAPTQFRNGFAIIFRDRVAVAMAAVRDQHLIADPHLAQQRPVAGEDPAVGDVFVGRAGELRRVGVEQQPFVVAVVEAGRAGAAASDAAQQASRRRWVRWHRR